MKESKKLQPCVRDEVGCGEKNCRIGPRISRLPRRSGDGMLELWVYGNSLIPSCRLEVSVAQFREEIYDPWAHSYMITLLVTVLRPKRVNPSREQTMRPPPSRLDWASGWGCRQPYMQL